MSAKTFTLSPDQELAILKLWNSGEDKNLYINEIMKSIFPDLPKDKQDGRSKEGRAVKKFLLNKGLEAKVTSKHYPKEKTELTEDI